MFPLKKFVALRNICFQNIFSTNVNVLSNQDNTILEKKIINHDEKYCKYCDYKKYHDNEMINVIDKLIGYAKYQDLKKLLIHINIINDIANNMRRIDKIRCSTGDSNTDKIRFYEHRFAHYCSSLYEDISYFPKVIQFDDIVRLKFNEIKKYLYHIKLIKNIIKLRNICKYQKQKELLRDYRTISDVANYIKYNEILQNQPSQLHNIHYEKKINEKSLLLKNMLEK